MATRDESHMFSLTALTERSPTPLPAPKHASPDPDNIDLGELARARPFPADLGPPLYPLGGLRADSARVAPNPDSRATPVGPLFLVVGALLVASGLLAIAAWSVQPPTPPSTRVPSPAGPCAHCPPQDLACNIKCRAKG